MDERRLSPIEKAMKEAIVEFDERVDSEEDYYEKARRDMDEIVKRKAEALRPSKEEISQICYQVHQSNTSFDSSKEKYQVGNEVVNRIFKPKRDDHDSKR